MSIYRYDAKVEITGAQYLSNDQLRVTFKLLTLFGDGSGKIGEDHDLILTPAALTADGGMAEILKACEHFTTLIEKDKKMQTQLEDINHKSINELTKIYNNMVPANKKVKKFRDRSAAVERLTSVLAGSKPRKMAKPSLEQRAKFAKRLLSGEEKKATPLKTSAALSGGRKANIDLKMTTSSGEGIAGGITLVGKKSQYAGKFLYKTQDKNPRREGTHGWHSWNALRNGMTYEQFILNKGGAKHLAWDIAHGFIEVRSKPRTN